MFPGSSTNTLQNTVPSNMKNTVGSSDVTCLLSVFHISQSHDTHFDSVFRLVHISIIIYIRQSGDVNNLLSLNGQ